MENPLLSLAVIDGAEQFHPRMSPAR